jgi:hypothetical protein
MKKVSLLMVCLLVCGMSVTADAIVKVWTPGLDGYSENSVHDTYIESSVGDWNFGLVDEAKSFNNGSNTVHTLVKFEDLSLPAGAVVIDAYVRMTVGGGVGVATVSSYIIADNNAGWSEGTQVATPAAAGDSTWNSMAHATPWNGGAGALGGATLTASQNVDSAWFSGNTEIWNLVPNATAQSWIDGGTNAGMLIAVAESSNYIKWRTSETYAGIPSVYDRRPELYVEYNIIPEPMTMSLLGLGGLALIRRKRNS